MSRLDRLNSANDSLYRAIECDGHGPVRSMLVASAARDLEAAGRDASPAWDLTSDASDSQLEELLANVRLMIAAELKIKTNYVFPPIPDRRWDWSAVAEEYEGGDPIGYGPTELAAIDDLLMELEVRL